MTTETVRNAVAREVRVYRGYRRRFPTLYSYADIRTYCYILTDFARAFPKETGR